MFLFITQEGDTQASAVTDLLRARGAEVLWFDPADVLTHGSLSVHAGTRHRTRMTWRKGSQRYALEDTRVAWYRRPRGIPDDGLGNSESRTFFSNLWHMLGCAWVPGPYSAQVKAERKLVQLEHARALGLELPPTLVTNDPHAFLEFHREHDGRVVSKLLGEGLSTHHPELARYTQFVTLRDVAYFRSMKEVPIIFQAYVPKALELRITVVGQKVFAAEIHSQATRRTRTDWRRYALAQTPHRPHTLPAHIIEACIRLTQRLGLCYSAMDFVLTPDGRYVFLESNPNGEWGWIESLTGMPITQALCDLLLELHQKPLAA